MFHLQVADQWPDIERHAAGRQLLAPAVAHHNFKWMDELFRVCNGCHVDFIARHAYACDTNSIMHYLHTTFQMWVVNDSTSSMVPFLGMSLVPDIHTTHCYLYWRKLNNTLTTLVE